MLPLYENPSWPSYKQVTSCFPSCWGALSHVCCLTHYGVHSAVLMEVTWNWRSVFLETLKLCENWICTQILSFGVMSRPEAIINDTANTIRNTGVHMSQSIVLSVGTWVPPAPEDICQCWEIFLVVTTEGVLLLASSRWKPGMLLHILQGLGRPLPRQRIAWPKCQ